MIISDVVVWGFFGYNSEFYVIVNYIYYWYLIIGRWVLEMVWLFMLELKCIRFVVIWFGVGFFVCWMIGMYVG